MKKHGVPEGDERYYEDEPRVPISAFDKTLLKEPLRMLRSRLPLVFAPTASVRDAMHAMQRDRRGCVLISEDGTQNSPLLGIFTERDVLLKIVDHKRDPNSLPLREVMTAHPESLPQEASIAWVLNKMAIGGFRHVPVIDQDGHPLRVVSVRDVIEFLVDFFPKEVLNLPPNFALNKMETPEGA